ncbi:MAG: T9SS type A sorting domain-containing protein [Bacteroidaceae bacterium]|nr:T9SS type A sorting domain-containing protein [Bacteroidaceae bacterium]
MKRFYLGCMALAMLVLPCMGAYAQSLEADGAPLVRHAAVMINGQELAGKPIQVEMTTMRDNLMMSYQPAVAVYNVVEEEDGMPYRHLIGRFYYATFRILFTDVETGVNDLYDGGEYDSDIDLGGLEAGCEVRVYDMSGVMRLQTTAGADHTVIGLGSLPAGMYIIKSGRCSIKVNKR